MNEMMEHTLKLGAGVVLKRSFFGASFGVVYAGRVSDWGYSIAVTWTWGYQSRSYNLFFSERQSELELPVGRMLVSRVTADEITFQYQR